MTEVLPVEQAGPIATSLELVAFTPSDMTRAQQALIVWCDRKLSSLRAEIAEANTALTQAREKKWASTPYKRIVSRLERSSVFYHKVKEATLAGYVIVPDFAINTFAIRVRETRAPRGETHHSYGSLAQRPDVLPEGVGQYVAPEPTRTSDTREVMENGKTKALTTYFADNWAEVPFPIAVSNPRTLTEIQKAMAARLFDEIGLVGGRRDPIIIGRILHHYDKYRSPGLSFFIAWWMTERQLEF